jgi:hypothetical protein
METFIWFIVIVFVILVVVGTFVTNSDLEKAKLAYEQALEHLDAHPSNVQLRKAALEKGRAYAERARATAGDKGVAVFDEVALSNDLAARTGVPANEPSTGEGVVSSPDSDDSKTCPDCAETIRLAARKCRFCGYEYS